MKWGSLYGPHYVNILYGMLARNVTGPFALYCFTDDTSGVRREVQCLPLPELGCEIPPDVPGKWPKQALWGRELCGLEGVALFLDLDLVIVANIDGFFELGEQDDVIVARNPLGALGRGAQTSIFRFRIGGHAHLLENLRADPERISRKYRMEQNYVGASLGRTLKFWPRRWTRHFRRHCLGRVPTRYLRAPIQPAGAKIIMFPGHLKPPHAIAGRWSDTQGPRTARQHLRLTWANSRSLSDLLEGIKCFNRPAQWIADHWRE